MRHGARRSRWFTLMLFDTSFRRELARNFSATLVVLVTIVVTVLIIRTLGQASDGRVNPSEVLLVMGFTVLGYLPIILTLSLFVAVTATLTRMYTQSEMVVWFSCGRSLFSFMRPAFRFAWPILLVIALLATLAWPWSSQQISELKDRFQGRADIERVAPGRFIESAAGQRVFFIDKDTADANSGTNIFITDNSHDKETVVSAQKGHVEIRNNARILVLNNGYRIETDGKTGDMRDTEFERYENRITPEIAMPAKSDSPSVITTRTLLMQRTPRNLAELSWRLGLPLAAFNLLLIGLAITRSNPRVGRSSSLVLALVTFATYYNLIGAGQNWIGRERITAGAFMLLLHGGTLVAALAWLLWRERTWRRRPDTLPASPVTA